MKKNILFCLFLTLLLPFVARTQNNDYYIQLEDASGFNTAPYQDSLEAHAYALVQALPDTFRNLFRVYDFGFYQHHEVTSGYPDAFEKKKAEVAALTPYYLLFGKQTDKTGVYTKIWVVAKLPEVGIFQCLTPTSRDLNNERLMNIIEGRYTQLGRSTLQYSDPIIVGIDELKTIIANINNGICCETDSERIFNILINMGFAMFPCKILQNSAARPLENTANRNTDDVLDFALFDIEEAGVPNDVNNSLNIIISGLKGRGLNAKGYITKNENICDSLKFEIVRSQYSTSLVDFDIWFHLWKNPYNNEGDILFVKSEKFDEIPSNFQSPPEVPWYPLTKSLLVSHVTTKCPPNIEINNFIGENVFESTWHVFAETNFSPIFFYRRNPQSGTFSGGCRTTSPDGLGTSYTPVSRIAFPDASWYEAKASVCDVYLSSYENQIKGHIENLQIAQPLACTSRAAWFNLVSTAGVDLAISVYRFAGGKKIQILHWEAWYKYNTNGKMEVKFGLKTALNRLAPSLF